MQDRLGEILVQKGLLTTDQLSAALQHQAKEGGALGSILGQRKFVSEEIVAQALGEQYGMRYVDLTDFGFDPEVIRLIPMDIAIRYKFVPLKKTGTTLTVATSDPSNLVALDFIKFMTAYNVESVVCSESSLGAAIEKNYGTEQSIALQKVYDQLEEAKDYELDLSEEGEELDASELEEASSEAPIIKLVNIIFAEAVRQSASDIHLEPYEGKFRVRYRIDGELYDVMSPPLKLRDSVISRIKIMSSLDISERRLPQDGRIKLHITRNTRRKQLDFRVSTLPTLFGEKVVLRILDQEKLPLDLDQLGFEPEAREKMKRAISTPYGIVLVTGPTGSGKTSTLYTALKKLNKPNVNIMTAEDPVEFNFEGINQVQTKEQIGLTFAKALRSFLRQDPNIIMLGEIRDLETAEIAFRAALTGHLVLSTLHTNDAPSTLIRLVDMGVEPFLVATSMNLICAQRLVRTICSECKEKVDTPTAALIDLGFSPEVAETVSVYRGEGCPRCNQSGYKGRIGLYEVLQVTPAIKQLILTGSQENQILNQARREGMITLRESGLEKIKSGMTTIDEVLRETREVETLSPSESPEPMVQVSVPAVQPPQPVAQPSQPAAVPAQPVAVPSQPAAQPPKIVDQQLQWGVFGETTVEQMILGIQNSKSGHVTAVAAGNKKKSKEAAKRFGIDQTYSSYEELLANPNVDAVCVCLPNSMRFEWISKALESNKHVLCEKPLATSEDEYQRMVEAAHKNDVLLIEALYYRRHPQQQFVRETLAEGKLGTIRKIHAHLQSPISDLSTCGGTFMNGGGDLVNLCRWLYQREPEKVSASFELDPEHEVEVSLNGTLDFGDGQNAVLESSFETHPRNSYYEVIGDRGRLVVKPFADSDQDSATVRLTIDGETSEKDFPATNIFTLEAEAFVSCLRKGGKALTSADDALRNMKVIEALYQSLCTGKHVTIDSEN